MTQESTPAGIQIPKTTPKTLEIPLAVSEIRETAHEIPSSLSSPSPISTNEGPRKDGPTSLIVYSRRKIGSKPTQV